MRVLTRALAALALTAALTLPAAPASACTQWRVTHYYPTGNPTASGAWPYPGSAAHISLPFGSLVEVGPYSVVILDRGGMWSSAWVDIYTETPGEITDGYYCARVTRYGWG